MDLVIEFFTVFIFAGGIKTANPENPYIIPPLLLRGDVALQQFDLGKS